MFTCRVTIKLKPNSAEEFIRATERLVVPLLRGRKGFRGVITSIDYERSEATSESTWGTEEDAEAYSRGGYLKVMGALQSVTEGVPKVQPFEYSEPGLYRLAA
jgi:hypothetical protein